MNRIRNIESCFIGLAIGDALGVPVEFGSRKQLSDRPVSDMIGFGTWNQPAGTWSDDSSLTFCLAESLTSEYNLEDIGNRMVKWMSEGYWGAHDKVFDIGGTTRTSLTRILKGENPMYSGEMEPDTNGNGSLMRIAPASIFFRDATDDELIERMREISGITHRHFRSVFACFIFSKLMSHLIRGSSKEVAFEMTLMETKNFISRNEFNPDEISRFERILDGSIVRAPENDISSGGYVLHTLEASLWCFMNTTTYEAAVLKAVNLGGDTDTTGCVTGALAGMYYGEQQIPVKWRNVLVKEHEILNLAKKFKQSVTHA